MTIHKLKELEESFDVVYEPLLLNKETQLLLR